jgi:hypothetical protein
VGNADLQFRQAAGGADYVQIKKDFVLVGNTTTGNNTVVNQYGIKQDETGGNNAEIYMTGGQITMRGNTSADSIGFDPDFTIASSGVVKIRRSASGAVDSLYGKNSSGELLAVKGVGAANIADGAVTGVKLGSINSTELRTALTDETGSGAAVFGTSPVLSSVKINGSGLLGGNLNLNYTGNGFSTGILSFSARDTARWSVFTAITNNNLSIYNAPNLTFPFTVKATNDYIGLGELDPQRRLHVAGEVRITDLNTDTPTRIVGADADGDLDDIKIGADFEITSDTLRIKSGIITSDKIANGAVTTLKIANYAIGPSQYGINYYILNDSASNSVASWIDGTFGAFRKLNVYTYIDSLTTANKEIVLPDPSFTYNGFEINFITENYNDSYAGTITLKTATGNYFRYYDTAVSKWVVKNGIDLQDVPNFRLICITFPRVDNVWYWVGTASGN